MPETLIENHTYYWQARAHDGELPGPWMPVASFLVNTANDAPGAPSLHAPADGSSVDTLLPMLSVSNAADHDIDDLSYDFEIYAGDVLVQRITRVPQDSSGITSFTLTAVLADNTKYRWTARAFDGDRYGPWMDMASFTVHIPQTSINATVDFDPDTLNKTSNGTWVVVYIEFPAGYDPAGVDVSSVRLEGTIPAESRPTGVVDHDKDGIPEPMVKFNRSDVINALPPGQAVAVTVTGMVNGVSFEGVDVIRVIE